MMKETNIHLIEQCRKGNRSAQLALYKQFATRLYNVCLRIIGNPQDAEEAMQDSFLKAFTRLEQYQAGTSFEAWLQQIAVRTAIDYIRRQLPEGEDLTDDYAELADDDTPDEEELQCSVAQVKAACQQLPTGYRVVLSLYLFEGYDMEEIASILNIRPASVRSQYLRGKRKLLEQLTKK